MERLTYKIDGLEEASLLCEKCGKSAISECWSQENCTQTAVDRLAEIEDILGDNYDLDRLRELVKADRDWQCGIPPVKMHQTIYRVFDGKIIEETVCNAIWEPFMARPRWKIWVMGSGLPYYWNDCIGKTVFITRESAKATLKGDQHGEQ